MKQTKQDCYICGSYKKRTYSFPVYDSQVDRQQLLSGSP